MPNDVIEEVSRLGIEILPDGENLRLRGDVHRLDERLKERIRASKAQLLEHFRTAATAAQPPAAPALRTLPVTDMQRAYLVGRTDHLEVGNTASQVYHEIEGAWDVAALEQALNQVIARHAALRSSFTPDGQQIEHPAETLAPYRIAVHDLRALPAGERQTAFTAVRAGMTGQPLPLDRPPLIEVAVSLLDDDGPQRMVLHVRHDGLAVDGVSMFILFRDWFDFYRDPGSVKPPVAVTRSDYLAALRALERSPEYEKARAYWMARTDTLPGHPQLPMQRRPDAVRSPSFVRRLVTLDAAPWRALKERAKQAGLTPTALLLAAYAETLSAWGAGRQFTLNLTLANRPPIHSDIFQSIGNFSTVLLLECGGGGGTSGGPDTFMRRALDLQTQLRRDIEHRHFSGIAALREMGRRHGDPAFARMPFTFNSTLGYIDESLDGSRIDAFGVEAYGVTATPQVWLNVFVMEKSGGSLAVEIDAVDGLFPDGLVEDLSDAYGRLLETLAADDTAWQQRVFDLLPPAQRERRAEANRTEAPIPPDMLQEVFLRRAEENPDAVAIRTASRTISYGELRDKAFGVADWLLANRVQRDELVAVVMPKGWEQIAAVLGTLIAGGAYLPVDPSLPDARISFLLRNGEVRCALTNVREVPPAVRDAGCSALDVNALPPRDPAAPRPAARVPGAAQDDLAYVLYTSGSTGTPKGVMISHRSVVNLVTDINQRFAVGASDRWFAVSQLHFDLSVYDVFGALWAGGTLVIPDADKATDASHWLDLATEAGVTMWNSVPAIVEMLVDQARTTGRKLPPSLRLVMMSGDRIPTPLPATIAALSAPTARVISLGGPTETTVWNICYPIGRVDPGWANIPYGKPTANNRYYVLNDELAPCPDWVRGMLYSAGTGLARGYWKDEARTAETFFDHPQIGERIYRTGDEGRYLPDGNIEILGRSDFQIKINGFRIETGEIETILASHPAVGAAAVVCHTASGGQKQLVAYAVPAESAAGSADRTTLRATLRAHLGEQLPDYMVPRRMVLLDALPLTANGKVNRKLLAAREPDDGEENSVPPPSAPHAGPETVITQPAAAEDGIEAAIAGIWRDLLDVETVAATDSFVRLGGDSLSAARLAGRLRKEFRVSIPLVQLMKLETVAAMAAHIRTTKT